MPVIKRYSNRKLYDTESKRYVTLDDVAEFIRLGEDVRVVDHVTGEDLTSLTLLQVVFEEEKKIGGLLPQVFMTRLIRAGGGTLQALRDRFASIDPFQVVDEEIRRRIKVLVEQSRLTEEESARMVDLLVRKPARGEEIHIPVKGEAEANASDPAAQEVPVAQEMPVPDEETSRPPSDAADPEEVQALLRQVEFLEQELNHLRAGTPPAPAQS